MAADVPVGLPPGISPLHPFLAGASKATAAGSKLAAKRAAGGPKARAAQSTWYEQYGYTPYVELPAYPGVTWTVGSWRYNSTFCNWYPMYHEWWWYGYNSGVQVRSVADAAALPTADRLGVQPVVGLMGAEIRAVTGERPPAALAALICRSPPADHC